MAYIKVDLFQISRTANGIHSFVKRTNKHMVTIDEIVSSLQTTWQGSDYTQILKKWTEINSKDSTTDKMMTTLTNYANAMRESGQKYKEAQARAIERANKLCT